MKQESENLYIGNQPIRVLQNLIPYSFENLSPDIAILTNSLIKRVNLKTAFHYHVNESAIFSDSGDQTPYVNDDNEIHFHETFLSYVWCISYSLISAYNLYATLDKSKTSDKELYDREESIFKVFSYGKSLITEFSIWDKNALPNPERFDEKEGLFISNANYGFLLAVCFILYHEFAHITQDHFLQMDLGNDSNAHILEFEKEADQKAIDVIRNGKDAETLKKIDIGVIVGLSAILHLKNDVSGGADHPDTDNRIHNFLVQINAEPTNPIWAVAAIAYYFWNPEFLKGFQQLDENETYKDHYDYVYEKVRTGK